MIELLNDESAIRIPLGTHRYHRVITFGESSSLIESWTRLYRFCRSRQNWVAFAFNRNTHGNGGDAQEASPPFFKNCNSATELGTLAMMGNADGNTRRPTPALLRRIWTRPLTDNTRALQASPVRFAACLEERKIIYFIVLGW